MQAAWIVAEEVCRIRCCFCVSHIEGEFLFEREIFLEQGDADGAFDVVRVECKKKRGTSRPDAQRSELED